ncbi:uncharacterized protein BDZ99DRAFT_513893 [Mytilinidion resinicola]|uniref:Zn(2)-C6 fungal-type domain-containing protein n=1 Tax=Mytilinidion resinicola TaxID=574789 RepID=A0A6A6ZAA3_9PEZI|nr:uncharacterized protein BDZ99DRAFT_513893 [Mytilinidion resinicola]KAF2817663.1 hypothetical protein BDZ99DRAFT_513893 [Mytilinidion resinicola]
MSSEVSSSLGKRKRARQAARPCDACRQRKTRCIMEDGPMCTVCQFRDSSYTFDAALPERKTYTKIPDIGRVATNEGSVLAYPPSSTSPSYARSHRSLNGVETEQLLDKTYQAQADIDALQLDLHLEAELNSQSSWLDLVRDPVERRKLVYSAGALTAQQINGIQWFYYFGTVFSKAIGFSDPFLLTLIVFIIQVVVVFAAVLFGCLGIPRGEVSPTFDKVIISFVIIEITVFNFAWGPLGWTIASEMAVGRNRNKIYAIAVACFWITVWVTVFTLPYLYYSANLGPKTGFIYIGLYFVSLAYVWFCVSEVTGRTMEEINGFFMDGIPARKWRDQPRLDAAPRSHMSDHVDVWDVKVDEKSIGTK